MPPHPSSPHAGQTLETSATTRDRLSPPSACGTARRQASTDERPVPHHGQFWPSVDSAVDAGLPRGLAGVSGSTLVVNFAGSHAAVREGMTNPTHHRRLT
jgi:hypothetical protein